MKCWLFLWLLKRIKEDICFYLKFFKAIDESLPKRALTVITRVFTLLFVSLSSFFFNFFFFFYALLFVVSELCSGHDALWKILKKKTETTTYKQTMSHF